MKRVDGILLRAFTLALPAAGGLVLVGLLVGDSSLMMRAIGPAIIGLSALVGLGRHHSAAPTLLVAAAVVVAQVSLTGSPTAYANGSLGVVALGLAATLIGTNRRIVLGSAASLLGLLNANRWWRLDEPSGELLASLVVALVVVVFGSQLVAWANVEIAGRAARFENLFDHSPVAMWEEDFTEVAQWLDRLRASGVRDLRAYLDRRPDRTKYAASLIRVRNANAAAAALVEAVSADLLLGPLDPDLILEEDLDTIRAELTAVWQNRPRLTTELRGRTVHGTPIDGYLLLAAPERGRVIDWSRVVVAMVDASEQRSAQRRLEGLIKSKDRFIASVSHELRTPLTAVIGLAEELRSNRAVDDAERTELISLIADQALEVGHIVDDPLVAARADVGTIVLRLEVVDVAHEVDHIVNALAPTDPPPITVDGPTEAKVDVQRLRQSFATFCRTHAATEDRWSSRRCAGTTARSRWRCGTTAPASRRSSQTRSSNRTKRPIRSLGSPDRSGSA